MVTTDPTSGSMKTGSMGLMSASKALSVSFEDHHDGMIMTDIKVLD